MHTLTFIKHWAVAKTLLLRLEKEERCHTISVTRGIRKANLNPTIMLAGIFSDAAKSKEPACFARTSKMPPSPGEPQTGYCTWTR
jgi:hypothetical protein